MTQSQNAVFAPGRIVPSGDTFVMTLVACFSLTITMFIIATVWVRRLA